MEALLTRMHVLLLGLLLLTYFYNVLCSTAGHAVR